jgi:hypothetical protein
MIRNVLRIGVAGCMLLGAAAQAQFEMEDMPEEPAPKLEKKAKKKKPAGALKELTLRGTIVRQEKEKQGKKQVTYQLQEQSGLKVRLPKAKNIDLDEFVDREVTVSGQGTETERKGRKVVALRKITEILPVTGLEEKPMADDEFPEEEPEEDEQDGFGEAS